MLSYFIYLLSKDTWTEKNGLSVDDLSLISLIGKGSKCAVEED